MTMLLGVGAVRLAADVGRISAEGSDSFDALSRSYAYTFQRPLHYLFYALVAAAIGWLGWLLVRSVAAGVIWMSYWAAGWAAVPHVSTPSWPANRSPASARRGRC